MKQETTLQEPMNKFTGIKKILREQEAKEQKAALEAAEKAHQENMARIEKKMAIINGDVVEEVKPKRTTKKTTTKTTKKPAAKKRGRPKKS